MSETTIDPNMPLVLPESKLHRDTIRLKPFADDYQEALQIQIVASGVVRQLTVQEILRQAIREGLPTVRKRYEAAATAAIKAGKK